MDLHRDYLIGYIWILITGHQVDGGNVEGHEEITWRQKKTDLFLSMEHDLKKSLNYSPFSSYYDQIAVNANIPSAPPTGHSRTPTDFLMDHVTWRILPDDLQERTDSSRKDKLHVPGLECGLPPATRWQGTIFILQHLRRLSKENEFLFNDFRWADSVASSSGQTLYIHLLSWMFTLSLSHFFLALPWIFLLQETRPLLWGGPTCGYGQFWPVPPPAGCVCRSFDLPRKGCNSIFRQIEL